MSGDIGTGGGNGGGNAGGGDAGGLGSLSSMGVDPVSNASTTTAARTRGQVLQAAGARDRGNAVRTAAHDAQLAARNREAVEEDAEMASLDGPSRTPTASVGRTTTIMPPLAGDTARR